MSPSASPDTATRSVDTLRPLVAVLEDRGCDLDAWFRVAGLSAADLDDPDRRITVAQSNALAEEAFEVTGDPTLGLRVVEKIGPGTADIFTYLAATSATGREAFERATRYVAVAGSDFEFGLEQEGEKIVCRTHSATSGGRVGRLAAEISVGTMVKLGRMVAGDLAVNEAWFRHPAPEYAGQYAEVFGMPVHFDARCDALVGRADHLDDPLPGADSALCNLLDQHARALFERVPRGDAFADRVRDTIVRELSSGDPSTEHVAEVLGVSPRTLRRRLKDEATSHQQLLDQVRNELACSYLEGGGLSVTEVAFLVGFSDASAFHKAFRRWTGESPGDWLRGRA